MLKFMRSQKVGHDLATEQKQQQSNHSPIKINLKKKIKLGQKKFCKIMSFARSNIMCVPTVNCREGLSVAFEGEIPFSVMKGL